MKIFLLFIILVFTFANCAVQSQADALLVKNIQTTPTAEVDDNVELPFSPFEIKELVEKKKTLDISQFWERLDLDSDAFDVVSNDDIDVNPASFDNDNLSDAVLIVWSSLASDSRIVLFQQQEVFNTPQEQWKVIGYVDVPEQRYGPPEYKVLIGTEKKWIVVQSITGAGSGVADYINSWYEITNRELKLILTYTSGGHVANSQVWDREYSTNIVNYAENEIEVEFVVDWECYFIEDLFDKDKVFSQKKKAFYDWDKANQKFVFNKSKSEISEQEIEDVYSLDAMNDELFLKYTYPNLVEIAQNGSSQQKQWLEYALNKLNDSKPKKQLEKLLKR